ncbi:MAG TPA: cellulose binding domain-containing protein, partial [Clostridia bacterium]
MLKKLGAFLLIVPVLLSLLILTPTSAQQARLPGIVYTQGTKFVLDGHPFYYAGCNSYDLFTKTNSEIDNRMQKLQDIGVKVLRTWAFSHETWHGFEPSKGQYSEEEFRTFDYIMKSAADHNIKVIATLENFWEAYGGIDSRLAWEGLPGKSYANRAKFFTDPGCTESYKNYLIHFLTRKNYYTGVLYKEDPTLFAWELMNEPRYEDAGEDVTSITLRKWVDTMGALVKSYDPNHMLSAGVEGQQTKYGYGGDCGNSFVYVQQSPYIDFCVAHPYPDEPWAGLSSQQAAKLVDAWIDDAHNVVGKPFVMEEFNTHSNKEEYWTAMYNEIESKDAAGDNFWEFNDISTSDFDLLAGDKLLTTVFKPHADKMAAKNDTLLHKPVAMNQVSPKDSASGLLPVVAFTWEPSVAADSYTLIVADNADFLNPLINDSGIKGTNYTPLKDLDYNKKYYWKVSAVNSLGSTTASNAGISFTTKAVPLSKPGAFHITAPVNAQVGVGLRPNFTWSASDEAVSYNIVVSKSSDYSAPLINASRITSTSYTPEVDLSLGVNYYWRVTAVNSLGQTVSDAGSFITVDLPPVNTTVSMQASINGNSKSETQYKIMVSNTGAFAVDKLSARIFVDLSEVYAAGFTAADISASSIYDQSGKATITGPIAWDAAKNIYYIQVDWNGYSIIPGGSTQECVSIRMKNWQAAWDGTNDYSYKGLGESMVSTDYITVYRGNLIMWGKEPANGAPVVKITFGDVN